MHPRCHENSRRRSFSATNASRNEAKIADIKLNIPMPCPPRGTVPVNTGAWFRECVSPQHVQFAFSKGCDHASYVGHKVALPVSTATAKSRCQPQPWPTFSFNRILGEHHWRETPTSYPKSASAAHPARIYRFPMNESRPLQYPFSTPSGRV